MTIANDLMEEVTARLKAASGLSTYPLPANVRRDHRVPVTLQKSPAIHIVDGDEEIVARRKNDCDVDVRLLFTVVIYVRNDEGFAYADPVKAEVMERLKCEGQSPVYPHSALIEPGRIRLDHEPADNDAVRAEMEFWFLFSRDKWTL